MRQKRRLLLLTAILATVVAGAGSASAATVSTQTAGATPQNHGPSVPHYDYYLALGDSLGAGWQPDPVTGVGAITGQGYASDIAADLKKANPHLQFTDLACPGETTTTMLNGGCAYPETYHSQIAAATAFLAAHHGSRVLVTLDIGANNIDGCMSASGIDTACVTSGLTAVGSDLPKILSRLKSAGGRGTSIFGMNYYDPFLAEWLTGTTGEGLATTSVALSAVFNGLLKTVYTLHGIPVADVSGTFDTADFTPLVLLTSTLKVPLNVAKICQWTWMCAPAPVGPNIHANATGYSQMAGAFEKVIFSPTRLWWW
ncbi:MAG TPA: SGNH/GDSL hydrolase family protein [Actinocrinis sp.]|nr:SGNH/GDSL hydrolase family protein [Actinocrinis sp.]